MEKAMMKSREGAMRVSRAMDRHNLAKAKADSGEKENNDDSSDAKKRK